MHLKGQHCTRDVRVVYNELYDGIQSQEFRHVIKTFYIDKTDFTVQYISLQYHRYYKKIVYLLYNVEKMQFIESEELSTWSQPCMIACALREGLAHAPSIP